jgi:hypothetical protein
VHTGVTYPRDGDLFGTAVNRLARLLGVCPPGAVLVSSATAGLLIDRAPEGLTLRAVGSVHLPGFASREEVHTVVGAGIATVSSLGSGGAGDEHAEAATGANSLPVIEADLVGRADELSAIWDALGRGPLVTGVRRWR